MHAPFAFASFDRLRVPEGASEIMKGPGKSGRDCAREGVTCYKFRGSKPDPLSSVLRFLLSCNEQ